MRDLDEVIDRGMAGLERKSRALNSKEREIVAYHEMGHALAGMLLPHADRVHGDELAQILAECGVSYHDYEPEPAV